MLKSIIGKNLSIIGRGLIESLFIKGTAWSLVPQVNLYRVHFKILMSSGITDGLVISIIFIMCLSLRKLTISVYFVLQEILI